MSAAKKRKTVASLKEAVTILNEAYQNDPAKTGKDIYSLKTIYNRISSKELTALGPRHHRQVSVDELLRVLGPKKAV